MRIKYRLRPNTMSEGWVAEPLEVDDPELQTRIKYTMMFGVGYGESKGEATEAMVQQLKDQATRNKIVKAHERAQLAEELEIEVE